MRTIKVVKDELKLWGSYWANKEIGRGFSSQSFINCIGQPLNKGNSPGEIYPPENIKAIGVTIDQLSSQCKKAIIQKYIKKNNVKLFDDNKLFNKWITKAEQQMLIT